MARGGVTGVLLVGGASRRFGSPKALARIADETLAERAWRILGEACDERIAVGKEGELELPFPVLDDGSDVRAPIAGVVAGLRHATHDVVVMLPVDTPLVPPSTLELLADRLFDADVAVTQTGPLPGAYRKAALPELEDALAAGRLSLREALENLNVAEVAVDESALVNVNVPDDLRSLG